ncbi:hypothetical protein FRC12_013468 [Ceratobasidium sp. 428]|nr:hypothetical protein FRC12_013468 [Ceratobasidium sp. 428]
MSQAGPSQAVSDSGAGRQTPVEKTQTVLDIIRSFNKYTLGDFLETMLTSTDALTPSARSIVTQWLSGQTRSGTRPAEILDAIYRHTSSLKHDKRQAQMSEYKDLRLPQAPPTARTALAVSFLPPNPTEEECENRVRYNSREGIEECAARAVLYSPTWDKLDSYSLEGERTIMKKDAPVMWAILSVAGLSPRKAARSQSDNLEESSSDSGEESDSDGDAGTGNWQLRAARNSAQKVTDTGVTFAVYILKGSRNQLVRFVRPFVGAALFCAGAPKTIWTLGEC